MVKLLWESNQITLLILCSSKLVALLKVIDVPVYVPDILCLAVSFKLSLAFTYSFFVLEMFTSFMSYIV